MKRHTIKLEDIKGFTAKIELAGSHGKGDDKSIVANVTFDNKEVLFKVINQNNVVTIEQDLEQDLEQAIEIYNEI